MHPLIHAWARDSLPGVERKIWASIALNTLLEAISLPPHGSSEKDGAFHRDILPHLEVCLSANDGSISSPTAGRGWLHLQFSKLVQPTMFLIMRDQVQNAAKCGWVFAERGRFDKASNHLQHVKDTLVQSLGETHDKSQVAMLGLAGVYWGLGRLEDAIALQRSVVDTRSQVLGPTHMETLRAMDHLGRSYWLHGLYIDALELQRITAQRMEAFIDSKHPDYPSLLTALDNLGVTLGAWRQYDESRKIHQRVLEEREKLFGSVHTETLNTKANLAMALLDLGDLEQARAHITEVYTERQKQLGKEHPWTLWALCYLSKVDMEAGSLQEAEYLVLWGIEAAKRSLSETHLGVLMGQGVLSRVYSRQGRYEEAEKLARETLESVEGSRGTSHPDYVFGLLGWTHLSILKGDYLKATTICQLALKNAKARITMAHPMSQQLQTMLQVLQDPSSSASDLMNLVPKTRQSAGPKDPEMAGAVRTSNSKMPRAPTW